MGKKTKKKIGEMLNFMVSFILFVFLIVFMITFAWKLSYSHWLLNYSWVEHPQAAKNYCNADIKHCNLNPFYKCSDSCKRVFELIE